MSAACFNEPERLRWVSDLQGAYVKFSKSSYPARRTLLQGEMCSVWFLDHLWCKQRPNDSLHKGSDTEEIRRITALTCPKYACLYFLRSFLSIIDFEVTFRVFVMWEIHSRSKQAIHFDSYRLSLHKRKWSLGLHTTRRAHQSGAYLQSAHFWIEQPRPQGFKH